MKIREIVEADRADWTRLRHALWPGSLSDHDAETRQHFTGAPTSLIVFVAEGDDGLVGFLELDYRKYGIAAHVALGYEEVERVVYFRRGIDADDV